MMSTLDELATIQLQTGQVLVGVIAVIIGILAAMAFSFWKWWFFMNYIPELFVNFPYGFGVGFALYTCLSLLSFGIRKAVSLLNIKS